MKENNIPLVRRQSGGGTVYHDLGNSCITILSDKHEPQRNLQFACEVLQKSFNMPAYISPRNDIYLDGFKVSGSAFRITNKAAFHHFTLLCSTDLEKLTQSLQPLLLELESKATASVRSKVLNLTERYANINHESICAAFSTRFAEAYPNPDAATSAEVWTQDDIMGLEEVRNERAQMMDWAFLYGRTPEFVHRLHYSTPKSSLELALTVVEGIITRVDAELEPNDFMVQNAISLALLGQPYHAETIASTLEAQEALIHDTEAQEAFGPIRTWLSQSVHS